MIKPFIGEYRLSQAFGGNPELYRQFIVTYPDGSKGSMMGHNGLDWAVPSGTPLVSPISGKVIEATMDSNGYGYYVKIENDQEGVLIAHMEKIAVQIGFILAAGDSIGTSDNTGYSTASHVHMGYYKIPRDRSNGYSGYIDPMPFLLPTSTEKMYTEEQYQAAMMDRERFWKERDEAYKTLKVVTEQLTDVTAKYSAISALGIESVEKLQEERKAYDDTITGHRSELSQVLDRNKTLASELAKKDEEDATAIDTGTTAIRRVKELEEEILEYKKTAHLAPKSDSGALVRFIADLLEHTKKKSDFNPGLSAPIVPAETGSSFWGQFWTATGLGSLVVFVIFGALQMFF